MAPQRPEQASSSRKAKPVLDIREPEITAMLRQYCDLRSRGFSQTEIRTKLRLKRHQPSQLLAEAAKRREPALHQLSDLPVPGAQVPKLPGRLRRY